MRILFFQSAGTGDLINATGIFHEIKNQHPEWKLDFLIPRKYAFVLRDAPYVNGVIYFDEHPDIPDHCLKNGHHSITIGKFANTYDHVINIWAGAWPNVVNEELAEIDRDFTSQMLVICKKLGFIGADTLRTSVRARFFYSDDDIRAADELFSRYQKFVRDRRIILCESESYSWPSPMRSTISNLIAYLGRTRCVTAGNSSQCQVSIKSLNLKQVKYFFDKYCSGFMGISSGITCAINAESTDFHNKSMLVNGLYECWDLSKFHECKPFKYHFSLKPFQIKDINSIFNPMENR